MTFRIIILLISLLILSRSSFAKNREEVKVDKGDMSEMTDSARNAVRTSNNDQFYERLRARSEKRKFTKWLYKTLILSPNKDTLNNLSVIDESRLFKPYEGKRIVSIETNRGQVFDEGGNFLERLANNTHVLTRDRVVRRDLLFNVGDTVNAELIVRNKHLMRSRSYIYDADIRFRTIEDDSSSVEMIVYTRDNWSLSADFDSNLNGNSMIELYDVNILGYGNKLSVKTNFNWSDAKYGGNIVTYEIPNILGSFFRGKITAGKDFEDENYGLEILKSFIKPTDYELGFEYNLKQEPYYLLYKDTTNNLNYEKLDAWAGYSHYLPSLKSSAYITGLYGYRDFQKRPEVSEKFNPYFHNKRYMMFGLGLYREKFYTSNLIYGYGFKEYLPAGYKTEVVSGYSWGEFYDNAYLGINFRKGGFTKIGYIMGGVQLGSSINLVTGEWTRSGVDFTLRYISNLLGIASRTLKIRQFATFNYTHGWNRDYGADEILTFTKASGPRGIDEYITGVNRMVLNTETVMFTPLQPLGFRMAFFAFADMGLLGYDNNPFKNNFYSTIGLGVRMKNERLIFSTIEIRLGMAFGKGGMMNADYVTVNSLPRIDQFRYLPTKPEKFMYR